MTPAPTREPGWSLAEKFDLVSSLEDLQDTVAHIVAVSTTPGSGKEEALEALRLLAKSHKIVRRIGLHLEPERSCLRRRT